MRVDSRTASDQTKRSPRNRLSRAAGDAPWGEAAQPHRGGPVYAITRTISSTLFE